MSAALAGDEMAVGLVESEARECLAIVQGNRRGGPRPGDVPDGAPAPTMQVDFEGTYQLRHPEQRATRPRVLTDLPLSTDHFGLPGPLPTDWDDYDGPLYAARLEPTSPRAPA